MDLVELSYDPKKLSKEVQEIVKNGELSRALLSSACLSWMFWHEHGETPKSAWTVILMQFLGL
jgi:hypothetical protein